ncbi:hypothetical protein NL676_008976 [Syzygium grande]|nr:hypothetical protein NL676_008976 [Syzygium grande]
MTRVLMAQVGSGGEGRISALGAKTEGKRAARPVTVSSAAGVLQFSDWLSVFLYNSMGIKTARSTVGWPQKSAARYNQRPTAPTSHKVCTYWLEGRCNRNPCRFLHDASLPRNVYHRAAKQSSYMPEDCHGKGPESSPVNSASSTSRERGDSSKDKNPHKPGEKHFLLDLLSSTAEAKMEQHESGTVTLVNVINLGGEVGCFTCEGPWVFVGVPNAIKAWNIQNGASYNISGPAGQVHAMEVAKNMLFARAQDGAILVWKGGSKAAPFQMAAPLMGHTRGVVSLTIERDRLYSGSIDRTVRVQELVGHTDVVRSLLCWDEYLISCSLDQTVMGILALSGLMDARGKPVLLCGCNDNTVRLYELPSFTERGKIFSRREVRTLETAPGGLFFMGDAAGILTVWK